MKTKTVKTYIKQLLKVHGGYEPVEKLLGIKERYIRYLEKGERVPSEHLRKLIKIVLKEAIVRNFRGK